MSSDGYPSVLEALHAAEIVTTICHRRQVTLPHLAVTWWQGEPSLEVQWFPTIESEKEDAEALRDAVAAGFDITGWDETDVALSRTIPVLGMDVEFTIYHRLEGRTP